MAIELHIGEDTMDKRQAKSIYEKNLGIAANDMLGFKPQILKPTKENLEKFRRQMEGLHLGCGCYSCVELGKMFIKSDHDLNEVVIGVSTKELESSR